MMLDAEKDLIKAQIVIKVLEILAPTFAAFENALKVFAEEDAKDQERLILLERRIEELERNTTK